MNALMTFTLAAICIARDLCVTEGKDHRACLCVQYGHSLSALARAFFSTAEGAYSGRYASSPCVFVQHRSMGTDGLVGPFTVAGNSELFNMCKTFRANNSCCNKLPFPDTVLDHSNLRPR